MSRIRFIIFLVTVAMLSSCKKDSAPPSVTIAWKAQNKGVDIIKGGNLKDVENRNFNFSALRFYVNNISLVGVDDVVTESKSVFLYDLGKNEFDIYYNFPAGKYKAIRFGLGLDPTTNESNPNSFADDHPLSIEQGMYWDMLKYRFLVMEGNFDNSPTGTGTPNQPFALHIGTDAMYRTVEIFKSIEITDGNNELDIPFEVNQILYTTGDTIKLTEHYSNDSNTPEQLVIGNKMMTNFKNALE